jgi:hypothetical protein
MAFALTLAGFERPAVADPYFNSTEPGCNGSDPNVLMCDDFEDGDWYVLDADTSGGGANAANDGWHGSIYANPITPAKAIRCGAGVTPFGACAADGGTHRGEGGRNMAQHYLKTATCGSDGSQFCGVNELYVRWYAKWDAGYKFGAEKHMNITTRDGDIAFTNIQLNCGAGEASSTARPHLQVIHGSLNERDYCGAQNQGKGITIQSGRWYFFELHVRVGGNALLEMWINDCGITGTSCGAAPVLRTRLTGKLPGNSNGTQIQTLWLENWANPPSVGNGPLWDSLKASRVGPIGFASAASVTAPSAPKSLMVQ